MVFHWVSFLLGVSATVAAVLLLHVLRERVARKLAERIVIVHDDGPTHCSACGDPVGFMHMAEDCRAAQRRQAWAWSRTPPPADHVAPDNRPPPP